MLQLTHIIPAVNNESSRDAFSILAK